MMSMLSRSDALDYFDMIHDLIKTAQDITSECEDVAMCEDTDGEDIFVTFSDLYATLEEMKTHVERAQYLLEEDIREEERGPHMDPLPF